MSHSYEELPRAAYDELPRPVAGFLLNGCKLNPRQALADCLRDLADEGLVRYETDPNGMPVFSLGTDAPGSGRPLQPLEEVALARVRSRAGRLSRVPFSALISDDGDDYQSWTRKQEEELGQEAKRAGLAEKSWPKGSWRVVLTLMALAVCAVVIVNGMDHKVGKDIAGPVLTVAFLLVFVPLALRKWRLTAEGTAAVGAWRRDGRGAAGTAQGLRADPERTVWALDGPGGAALPRGYAWSSLGGQWHTVKLGQVESRPFWSTFHGAGFLLMYAFIGSLFAVMIGGVVFRFDALGAPIALGPAALVTLVLVGAWLPAYTSRMRLPDNVTFPGEVIRLEFIDGGDDPDKYLVWIDTGYPVSMKFDVGAALYRRLSVGDLVQVNWSPRRRCLNGID